MKAIILGLGNPILGDDAIGCRIAELVEKQLIEEKIEDFEVEQFYRGGIALMERLIGYDRALIIDSIMGWGEEIGTIYQMSLDDLPTMTADSPHDTSLKAALELGRTLNAKLPEQVDILAMEIKYSLEFSEELSKPVEASIPEMVGRAMDWVKDLQAE